MTRPIFEDNQLYIEGQHARPWRGDHGRLDGLSDDDHLQYHTDDRADTWHTALDGDHVTNGDNHDHAGGDGAQIDHGGAGGLGDDDHAQYLLLAGRSPTQLAAGPLKVGGASHHTEFEADGTPVFVGDATNWNDINVPLLSMTLGASVPDIIAVNGDSLLKVRAFDGNATTEQLGGSLEILHDYKEGTDITPHVHWAPTTPGTGNVKWQLRYMWANRNAVIAGGATIDVTVAAGGTAWQETRSSFPAISGSGMGIGSRFVFVLFRNPADGADTYADDAACFDFGIHYERDTIGSRQISAK